MNQTAITAALLFGAVGAFGQPATFEVPVPPPLEGEVQTDVVRFVSSEFSWREEIVKGAPYAAQAITETVQTLADGNRIVRKNSSRLFRDSQGRTRREQTLDLVGPWVSDQPHVTVLINDSVGGVNYILETDSKIARKITVPKTGMEGGGGIVGGWLE